MTSEDKDSIVACCIAVIVVCVLLFFTMGMAYSSGKDEGRREAEAECARKLEKLGRPAEDPAK